MKSYGQSHEPRNVRNKHMDKADLAAIGAPSRFGKRSSKNRRDQRRVLNKKARRHGKKIATVDEAREIVNGILSESASVTEGASSLAKAAMAASRAFTEAIGSLSPADAREIESDIKGYLIKQAPGWIG